MNIIMFDARLIEMDDLAAIQEHIEDNQPCVAYFKVTYPSGSSNYFMAACDGNSYSSVSIGKPAYDIIARLYV